MNELMKNVDVNAIISTSVELNEIVSSVKGAIDGCINACSDLFASVQTLSDYNGKKVAGSDYYKHIERNIDGNIIKKIRHSYNLWMITGTDSILEYCRSLQSEVGRLEDTMNKVYSELLSIDVSGGVIDSFINDAESQLKNYELDPKSMELAFEYLNGKPGELSKIAYDGERAANGDTIASDKILTKYWIDKPLSFEKQDDGTYISMQDDDLGNPTVMGSLSAMGTAVYLATLMNSTGAASKDAYLLMKAEQDAKMAEKNLGYSKIINVEGDELRYYKDESENIVKVVKVDKETGTETIIEDNGDSVAGTDSFSIAGSNSLVGGDILQDAYSNVPDRVVETASVVEEVGSDNLSIAGSKSLVGGDILQDTYGNVPDRVVETASVVEEAGSDNLSIAGSKSLVGGDILQDTYGNVPDRVVETASMASGFGSTTNEVAQEVSNNAIPSEFSYIQNASEKELLNLIKDDKNFVIPEGTVVSFAGTDFTAQKDMYYEYDVVNKGYKLLNSDGSKSGNYPKSMISKWELK